LKKKNEKRNLYTSGNGHLVRPAFPSLYLSTTLTIHSYVLVTGATGFIGAHIVDNLLARGLKVRGATRSPSKAQSMLSARPNYTSKLDFVIIRDFEQTGVFDDAVQGIDAVIHVASVLPPLPPKSQ
jgi:NAD(P)-dependent dehydrogenase (short-subunit alcohol dehydrogenase family)